MNRGYYDIIVSSSPDRWHEDRILTLPVGVIYRIKTEADLSLDTAGRAACSAKCIPAEVDPLTSQLTLVWSRWTTGLAVVIYAAAGTNLTTVTISGGRSVPPESDVESEQPSTVQDEVQHIGV